MIENVLNQIDGVGIYGVISICIFFAVFTIAFIWMMSLKKSHLRAMSELPLNDGSLPTNKSETANQNLRHE